MKKKEFAGLGFLVVLMAAAIFVAADGTIKTNSGDVKLFGQGQSTYGVGVSKATDYPAIKSIGAGSIGLTSDQANSYTSLDVYPSGTGTTSYLQLYGKGQMDSNAISKLIINHNNVRGIIFTYAVGGGMVAGDLQLYGQGQTARGIAVSDDGSSPQIKSTAGYIVLDAAGDKVIPADNNQTDLGSANNMWHDIYYKNGLVTSSAGYLVPENKNAVGIVSEIETKPDGEIDHSTVDDSLLVYKTDYSENYYKELEEIRELIPKEESGIMKELGLEGEEGLNLMRDVDIYQEIAKKHSFNAYLNNQTQEYELISISKLIVAQAEAIKELKAELCAKDGSYSFC